MNTKQIQMDDEQRQYRENANQWSTWIKILNPTCRRGHNCKERRTGFPGCINDANVRLLQREGCGIYEWRTVKGDNSYVVYIGSTCVQSCRGNGCSCPQVDSHCSLIRRIRAYAKHGSHKSEQFNNALVNGYSLEVRYKKCENSDKARSLENARLERYDYAWNIRNNGQQRQVP